LLLMLRPKGQLDKQFTIQKWDFCSAVERFACAG